MSFGLNYDNYNYDKYILLLPQSSFGFTFINSEKYNAALKIDENNTYFKSLFKPLKPYNIGGFIQNKLLYDKLVCEFGFRLDYFNSNYDNIKDGNSTEYSPNTNVYFSPRLNILYSFNQNHTLTLGTGIFYMMNRFEDILNYNFYYRLRGFQIISNPGLEPIKNFSTQLSYIGNINNITGIKVSIYSNLYENLTNETIVSTLPVYYYLKTSKSSSNNYGIEIALKKNFLKYFDFECNYTYNYTETSINYFLNKDHRSYDLNNYPEYVSSDYEIPHRLNCILGFHIGNNQGLEIFGIQPFENFDISLISKLYSGYPYSLNNPYYNDNYYVVTNYEFNNNRVPANYYFDLRISKKIYIRNTNTSKTDNIYIAFSLDIFNLFNNTYNYFDNKNNIYNKYFKSEAGFSYTPLYKEADMSNVITISSSQYDYYGNRLYNSRADFDNNGIVTQHEKFLAYTKFYEDYAHSYFYTGQLRSAFFTVSLGF